MGMFGIPVIGFDSGVPGAPEGAIKATASTNNENAAAIAATDSAISVAAQRTVFFVSRFFIAFSAV